MSKIILKEANNDEVPSLEVYITKLEDSKPKRETSEYYGDRYSIPVLILKEKTPKIVCYDFNSGGWVDTSLDYGPDADDYTYQGITEWVDISDLHKKVE